MDSTFLATLADAAMTPAFLLATALVIFVGGLLVGALVRDAFHQPPDDEAGDTHPHFFAQCTCRVEPVGASQRVLQIVSRDCALHRVTR
jgi:hypothetical protein